MNNKRLLTLIIILAVAGLIAGVSLGQKQTSETDTVMISEDVALENPIVVEDINIETQPEPQIEESTPKSTPKPTPTPEPEPTPSEPTFTLADVAMHNTESDCYSAINGVVYDLTAWIHKHPGGDRNILRICGIDGSQAYNSQHGHSTKANNILAGFEVGVLVN